MHPLKRAISIYSKWGVRGLAAWARAICRRKRDELDFSRFSIAQSSADVLSVENGPLISVIVPVYNVDERWLRKCIDLVRVQTYQNWELCIADDASTADHIRPVLEEYALADTRIKIFYRQTNGHISAASNSALELATGEFCVLLDHDDELSGDALYWVACEMIEHPKAALIYSDEDLTDENGKRSVPKFKPDFSRDLMYSLNLVTHLSAYRTEIIKEIGGFRKGMEGSQDYDLALRVVERIDETQIRHIPRILYHWRAIPGSVAFGGDEKPYAHERARQAIRDHFERTGVSATVEKTHFNLHRVRYPLPETPPPLSVVVWSDNSDRSVLADDVNTLAYPIDHIEFIEADRLAPLARSLNAAVASSSGEIIVFLRNGVESVSESPLSELASFALQPSIGCVGGIVLGRGGTIEAGGLILGGDAIANVAHQALPEHMPGNMIRNLVNSNFRAVCLDVFGIQREVFLGVNGFDEGLADKDLLAADLCLRVGQIGQRIVLTPYAKFACSRSRSSGKQSISAEERNHFQSKWRDVVEEDPHSNRNLSSDGRFSIRL